MPIIYLINLISEKGVKNHLKVNNMQKMLYTKDVVKGIAKCANGNLGVVIQMTPSLSDLIDLKFDGINGIQYKVIPFEMALTLSSKGDVFIDSNGNDWEIINCDCD